MLDRERANDLQRNLSDHRLYCEDYHQQVESEGFIDQESPGTIKLIDAVLARLNEAELPTTDELAQTIRDTLIEMVEQDEPIDLEAFDCIQEYANLILLTINRKPVELIFLKVGFADYAWGEIIDNCFVPVGKWDKS
jgi:hypothetical protein